MPACSYLKLFFMLNINMQLERDNVSSAGPLQSIASAFVRSFLVHAAGVFQTTHVDTIKQPQ